MKTQNGSGGQPRHPIGVVAERTGLSTHVLRVWERRYGVVRPCRSEAGQRLYSDADLERLNLLRRAVGFGRSIGRIALLSGEDLVALVAEDEAARVSMPSNRGRGLSDARLPEEFREQALKDVLQLDDPALASTLRRAAVALGVPVFLEQVAAPLLREIGERWHGGRASMAQEHLATVVMRRILGWLAEVSPVPPGAPLLVVSTPAGERHEIGALLVVASAAVEGWRVTYLGPDLPALEIAGVVAATGARAVASSVIFAADRSRLEYELLTLRAALPPDVPLFVGGGGLGPLDRILREPGVQAIADLSTFRDALRGALHGALN